MADPTLEEQQRQQRALDVRRAREFQTMVTSEGWKLFQELLNNKVNSLMATTFDRPEGEGNRRGEDFDKGTCYALLWARDLPNVTIQGLKDQNSAAEDGADK